MRLIRSKFSVAYGLGEMTYVPAGQMKLIDGSGTVATFSSLEECDLRLAAMGLRRIGDFGKAGDPWAAFWYDECPLEET